MVDHSFQFFFMIADTSPKGLDPVVPLEVEPFSCDYARVGRVLCLERDVVAEVENKGDYESTKHRSQITDHRLQSIERRAQSTEHRAQSTEHIAQSRRWARHGKAARGEKGRVGTEVDHRE